jgi:hypothetical protein
MPRPVEVDLSFMDEAADDPAELLKAMPEIRYEVAPTPTDDDLGLRTLLERPEAFTLPWWRDQAGRSRANARLSSLAAPWRAA